MGKRPIVIITVCFIIGIIMGLYLKINTAFFVFLCIIVLYVLFIFFSKYFKSDAKLSKYSFLLCIIIILVSHIWIQIKETRFKTLCFETTENYSFQGVIVDVQKQSDYYDNYIIEIQSINGDYKYKNINVILKVKNKDCSNTLEYGDLIDGYGCFEKPEGKRNYKGFDYSQYLKTKNVYMICKSDYMSINISKKNFNFVGKMWITNLRNKFNTNLRKILDKDCAGVACSILLGDSSSIDDEQRQCFSDASLLHILAISGMHVSYVVMFLTFSLKKCDTRKRKIFLIIFLVFFMNLTGCSPSVVRAVIMSCIAISSKLFYRKSDTINNIALSCLVILISNPYNILNLGFQLSFLGTLGIVLFNDKISSYIDGFIKNKFLKKVSSILVMGISANMMILPILINTYNTISFTFIVSTILVTPILFIMIILGYLTLLISLVSLKLASIIAFPFSIVISLFNLIAKFSSNILFLKFVIGTPNLVEFILYYFIVFYIFFFFKKSHIKIASKLVIFCTIFCFVFTVCSNRAKGITVYFIDVGQGDSCLIKTESNKTVLIDGGGSEGSNYDVGKNVLVPYLLDRKITKIDYIFISHFDSDHVQGLFSVMENLKVKNTVISKQGEVSDNYKYFLILVKVKKINVIIVKAGDRVQIDNSTYFDILWPQGELINANVLNNNSIVCKLHYKNVSILFTGDIEKISEEKISSFYKNSLKSTVLKVAHHGSKSSSIQEFIDCVRPQIALIGVGEGNKFGHPNSDVIERFENCRLCCL